MSLTRFCELGRDIGTTWVGTYHTPTIALALILGESASPLEIFFAIKVKETTIKSQGVVHVHCLLSVCTPEVVGNAQTTVKKARSGACYAIALLKLLEINNCHHA